MYEDVSAYVLGAVRYLVQCAHVSLVLSSCSEQEGPQQWLRVRR